MPQREMVHELDPKENLKSQIGDKIDDLEIYNNQILVAIYIRPQKTKTGIYLPDSIVAEDQYQSKIGLVLTKGPSAFAVSEDSEWFKDIDVEVGDWIVFRPSDGWPVTINNVLCRMLDDTSVRGKVVHPDTIW
jgi:co-chaperonin GroES (HSP10)